MTKWLVTGGCGFIGTSLIKRLNYQQDNLIRVLDNLSVGTREDLGKVANYVEFQSDEPFQSLDKQPYQLIQADITDAHLANKACEGIDVIIHLAANTGVPKSVENPRLDMESNVIGTFNILEAARANNIKKLIFASSGAPAGEVNPPIHEELAAHPVSPYGASKLAGEGYCSSYYRTFGIETISLRFGNVYGPGSVHKSSVVAKFIKSALRGETVEVYGDGAQTRDFIYIDDLIDAILKSSFTEGVGGEIFQIATAKETTINELIVIIKKVLFENGIELNINHTQERLGDVKRNFSDTSKAKRLLDWESKTSLEHGIKKTLEFFIRNKA